jgi:hypothetical protein
MKLWLLLPWGVRHVGDGSHECIAVARPVANNHLHSVLSPENLLLGFLGGGWHESAGSQIPAIRIFEVWKLEGHDLARW